MNLENEDFAGVAEAGGAAGVGVLVFCCALVS
jgi:hypothetical protein